jgi:hypothetical protein
MDNFHLWNASYYHHLPRQPARLAKSRGMSLLLQASEGGWILMFQKNMKLRNLDFSLTVKYVPAQLELCLH